MQGVETKSVHVAHCSHNSQHWHLLERACAGETIHSVAILTGDSLDTRRLQKLRSKFVRIIFCGTGKKLDAVSVGLGNARVEIRRLRAIPPSSLQTGVASGNVSPPLRCDFTLVIGIDHSGRPKFVIWGNYALSATPSRKPDTGVLHRDPLDRSTYVGSSDISEKAFAVYDEMWRMSSPVATSDESLQSAMTSLPADVTEASKSTVRKRPINNRINPMYIAQGILTNAHIAFSLGDTKHSAQLIAAVLADPNVLSVDALLGKDTFLADLGPLLQKQRSIRVIHISKFSPEIYALHSSCQVKFVEQHQENTGPAHDILTERKSVSVRKQTLRGASAFVLIGKNSECRAMFCLEGSISSGARQAYGQSKASMSTEAVLSYCVYIKSADASGIVEAHSRNFNDMFNVL